MVRKYYFPFQFYCMTLDLLFEMIHFSRSKLHTFRDLNLICSLLLSASSKNVLNLNLSRRVVPGMLYSVVEFPFLTQGINFSSCFCTAVICAAVKFIWCILRLDNPAVMFLGCVVYVSLKPNEAFALTSLVMILGPKKPHR